MSADDPTPGNNEPPFPGWGAPGAGQEFSRRAFIAFGAAAAAVAAVPVGKASAAKARDAGLAAANREWQRSFVAPPRAVAPRFRWWWPNGQVDNAEIAAEVDQAAAIGAGGLEVADIHASGLLTLDAQTLGWGSEAWVGALATALREARRKDMTIDLTLGPGYPVCAQAITPDSPEASAELAHGVVTVPAGMTFTGAVPAALTPAASSEVTVQTLIRVQAVQTTGPAVKAITPLDQATLFDLTDTVSNGQIKWTAPAGGGDWVLLSYWLRGSGQQPKGGGDYMDPEPFVVDHFSAIGTRAVLDMWEQMILNREVRGLLRKTGVAFFEDSLELSQVPTIWTPNLLDEFEQALGYDLTPFLPVVVTIKGKFQFTYGAIDVHAQDDYNAVLSNLYMNNHLLAFMKFATGLGMTYRMQPYGEQTDSLFFCSFLGIPEGETLGFKNLDDYRVMTGGRDLAGHRELSCEALAEANTAYSLTWERGLQTVTSAYAGGVNQAVIHGFAYNDAPGATWPGFAAWSPDDGAIGFSEAWGPRQPTWQHIPDIAAFLARTQWVLQTGTPKYDLLFYRQKGYTATGIGAPWSTNSGIPIGWTHAFATDRVLELPGVVVRNGRLAPEGPAFGAIVLDVDQFGGNIAEISPDGARLLLGFANAGLPTIVLGDWSAPVSTGVVSAQVDASVQAMIAELLTLPTVVNVLDQNDIPTALAKLGVTPRVSYTSSSLMNVHRTDGDTDIYYLANARHAENRVITPINQTAFLTAQAAGAVPYQLDAWTGEISRIAQFTVQNGMIGVNVALNPGETMIVVLAPPGWAGETKKAPQITATDADAVFLDGDSVVLRASQAGTFTAKLADGTVRTAAIGDVPVPIPLTSWSLVAEDWQPGATAHDTIKPTVSVALDTLQPWTAIPQLANSSGVGYYSTTVTLASTWSRDMGATLSLGSVVDTFRVWVNGKQVPQQGLLASSIDLRGMLRPGPNTIQVDVATTLINRIRLVTPSIYGIAKPLAYGLMGPVRLTPYAHAVATPAHGNSEQND